MTDSAGISAATLADWRAEGFEEVTLLAHPDAGLEGIALIHDTTRGPAFGGIRLWPYRNLDAAFADGIHLARDMTLKLAAAELPGGGGKIVLVDHPALKRAAALEFVAHWLNSRHGRFRAGRDVGLTADDAAAMAALTPYMADERAGMLAQGTATAHGVFVAWQRLAPLVFARDSLAGLTIAVQGLGAVGMALAAELAEAGVRLLVADLDSARVAEAVKRFGAAPVAVDAIVGVRADGLAPCALGGVVTAANVASVRVRAIAGSANAVVTDPVVIARLHERGVFLAPDFLVNAGAVMAGVAWYANRAAPEPPDFEALGARVASVARESLATGRPPHDVALARARQKLARPRQAADSFWPPPPTRNRS